MVTKDSIDNIDEQIEKLKNSGQNFEVESNSPEMVDETIDKFEDTDTKVFNGNEELENKNNDNDILIILILIILIILVVLFGFILIY